MKKIIHYLIYLFVFLLPFQTRWIYDSQYLQNSFWEYGSKFIYATQILLGIIIILSIVFLYSKKSDITLPKIFSAKKSLLFLLIGLVLIALPIIFSLNKQISLQKITWCILGFALIFIILSVKPKTEKICLALIVAGFIQSIFAISQFITQKVYASKLLGMATQDPQILGTSVIESAGSRILRAYGTLPHPNILAGFLTITLLINIALYSLEKNKKTKIAYSVIFITNYFALLFTASRAAILGLFIGLIVYLLLVNKKQNFTLQKSISYFLIIIIIISVFFSLDQPQITQSRLLGNQRLEKISTQERLGSYEDSWQIFKKNWLWGTGPGNYTLALSKINPDQPAYTYQPLHNSILLPIIEMGIWGILIYVYFIYLIIILLKKRILNFNRQPLTLAFTACLSALFTVSLFDHWLSSFYFGIIFSLIIISLFIKSLFQLGK